MLETWPTAALAERHRRRQLPSSRIDARRIRADEQLGVYRLLSSTVITPPMDSFHRTFGQAEMTALAGRTLVVSCV